MTDIHPQSPLGSPPATAPPVHDAAPELAAAMAETRIVRDKLAGLCGEFYDSPLSGQTARVRRGTPSRASPTATGEP